MPKKKIVAKKTATKKHPSKLAVHFSSKRGDHPTPDWLYAYTDKKFKFKMDLAASAGNKKHDKFFSVKEDALQQTWPKGYSWVNPPYGKGLVNWAKKAHEQSLEGRNSVMLLPARTDTKWYHKYVLPFAKQIVFIEGRLTFKGSKDGAPFPSMLVIWAKRDKEDIEMRALSKEKRLEIEGGKKGRSKGVQ